MNVLLLLLPSVALVLISVGLDAFLKKFNRVTRQITTQMQHAQTMDEYRRLHMLLRCHYLCLIPFVTEKNVMRVYRIFFRSKKQTEKRSDGFGHLLAPSLAAACLCAVCLGGTSLAWFTATNSATTASVQSAVYTVSVTAMKGTETVSPTAGANGTQTLALTGGTYSVSLTATGSAATGYCRLSIAGREYTTPAIPKGSSFRFSVQLNGSGTLTILPAWGASGTEANLQPETTLIITVDNGANVALTEPTEPTDTTAEPTAEPTEGTEPTSPTEAATDAPTNAPTTGAAEPTEPTESPTDVPAETEPTTDAPTDTVG